MLKFEYKPILKLVVVLTLCAVILPGCTSQFTPDGWAGPALSDNTLYVISEKTGEFLAIDLDNPNAPFKLTPEMDDKSSGFGCQPSSSGLVGYATPVIHEGIAYIADYDGDVFAIDIEDGTEAWRAPVETDGPIVGNPIVFEDHLIVPSGKKLYSINLADGAFTWNSPFKANGEIWSSPAVSDGKVYFGTLDHSLYAVDAVSGQLFWKKDFSAPVASTPLIVDGTIYIGTFESKFYALDAQTGDEKWDEPFEASDWFWTTAAYKDRVVYVGSLDKMVYAIDAATGKAKWSQPFETEGPIRSAAVIVDDVLLVAAKTGNGSVYGIDIETGQPKWSPLNLGSIYADPWVDGTTVYYLTRSDELYTLNVETGNSTGPVSIDVDFD